jgi:hypothetical protein
MIDAGIVASACAMPIGSSQTFSGRRKLQAHRDAQEIDVECRCDTAISCQGSAGERIAISPTAMFMVFSSNAAQSRPPAGAGYCRNDMAIMDVVR